MSNQIFNSFDRTKFSDEIFSIFGRALAVATRFDASCKTLARMPLFKVSLVAKQALSNDEYDEMVKKIVNKYKNLNRAIDLLKLDDDITGILNISRESRNELVHEAMLEAVNGFDKMNSTELDQLFSYVENMMLQVIKGDVLVSTIISIQNKEPVSDYPFSKEYESKYINWVMERFEK